MLRKEENDQFLLQRKKKMVFIGLLALTLLRQFTNLLDLSEAHERRCMPSVPLHRACTGRDVHS
jgi:hypothetical protein